MLTPIQQKIYQFIQEYIQEHNYAPSLREIAIGIGISPRSKSLISRYVHVLIKEGWLDRDENGYRNIKLNATATAAANNNSLPVLGRIAAGLPIEAITTPESLDLGGLFNKSGHYVLEVKGNSMLEEGIWDGDNIICRQQDTAREGEIVVALIDNQEATLKRISFSPPGFITLIPANIQFRSQCYPADRVTIQGVFIGLLRLTKRI